TPKDPKKPTPDRYQSSDAVPTAKWNAYASVITGATTAHPKIVTGKVSHRVIHTGNICTQGTTCAATVPEKDRSFADMTDVSFDERGRLGVVYMDNNSAMQTPADKAAPRLGPFVFWARQTFGPTLRADKPSINQHVRKNRTSDPTGDATWPNVQGAANLDGLDLTSAKVCRKRKTLVAKFGLASAKTEAMRAAFDGYTGVVMAEPPAERLQYVVRFATQKQVFHLSAEFLPDGTLSYFGGKMNDNDKLTNGVSMLGAGYHADENIKVKGAFKGNVVTLKTPLKSFKFKKNKRLFSATAFGMAGPAEANETTILRTMRTVDATPPFDVRLRSC
ncbi:MAG: hypothetical protein QOH90_840, partial [Actinomycetota bacterium]|nr:hypothetical protein [Actinomycetota bacterium]